MNKPILREAGVFLALLAIFMLMPLAFGGSVPGVGLIVLFLASYAVVSAIRYTLWRRRVARPA